MAAPPSPRLPSPPPFTEVQIEGSSASPSKAAPPAATPAPPANKTRATITRRIRPGSKCRDISTGPSPLDLHDVDSAFQLQEHLASLLTEKTTTMTPGSPTPHSIPISKDSAAAIANPPSGVDPQLWCYELTRRLTRDLNHLIVALLQDNCTSKTCPQMRASEWQYLCAVHDPPQSCCAIDYSCHTLDHAATILTSSRYFPSRLNLTAQGGKHLSSIFRRLYRIFAHAWFQHRGVFWEVEGEWGLYLFFKTVSERYNLIPEDNLTIPAEAENGAEAGADEFSRGSGGEGDDGSSAKGGQDENEKKEGSDEDDEVDYGSDDSDESDGHSGSGSSSDDGEGAEGDAFELELPMEGTQEVKNVSAGVSEELVNGEEVVEDSGKREDEPGNSEGEGEGEEIPLVMEQEDMGSAPREPSKSPSSPAVDTPPPGSPPPPPAEEAGEGEEEKYGEAESEEQGKLEPVPPTVEAEVAGEEDKQEQEGQVEIGKEVESEEVKEKEKEEEAVDSLEVEVKSEETKDKQEETGIESS